VKTIKEMKMRAIEDERREQELVMNVENIQTLAGEMNIRMTIGRQRTRTGGARRAR
jgi:hypothetical protein